MKKILSLIGIAGLMTTKLSLGMQDPLLRLSILKTLNCLLKEARGGSIGAALAIDDIKIAAWMHWDFGEPFQIEDAPSKDFLRKYQFLTEYEITKYKICRRILDELTTMRIDSEKGIGELMKGIDEKDKDPSQISMYVVDLIQSIKITANSKVMHKSYEG